jgi:hypothetical protein
MLIYLDTVLWNHLCDERVDAARLTSALFNSGRKLVLGTEAIYEMSRTFNSKPSRGRELFGYLKTFTDLHVPCMQDNPRILQAEAESALNGEPRDIDVFWNEANYASMQREVEKLSQGIVDDRATIAIASRKQLADRERTSMSAQYLIDSELKNRLLRVEAKDLDLWMRREFTRSGRLLFKQRLAAQFSDLQPRQLTILSKKILASGRYRLSHAVVRADLYANWRSRNGAMPRDLLADLDHVVTASHCDVYASKETAQERYTSLILRNTRTAIYYGNTPLEEWFKSL